MARWPLLLAFVASTLFSAGCGSGCCDGETSTNPGGTPVQAPTFLLEDVNDTSATYQQVLSPRSQLGRISAWYFGAAG